LSDSCRGSFRMSRLLRTTAKSIGVDPVPFSALRRVFACRLVGSGAPISAVMHCPGRRDCDGGLEIWLSPDYHCEQVSLNLAKIGEL
jgi:integrase